MFVHSQNFSGNSKVILTCLGLFLYLLLLVNLVFFNLVVKRNFEGISWNSVPERCSRSFKFLLTCICLFLPCFFRFFWIHVLEDLFSALNVENDFFENFDVVSGREELRNGFFLKRIHLQISPLGEVGFAIFLGQHLYFITACSCTRFFLVVAIGAVFASLISAFVSLFVDFRFA